MGDRQDRDGGALNGGAVKRGSLLAGACVVGLAIALLGIRLLTNRQAEARNSALLDLVAVADLEVGQIVEWRHERIGDARLVSATPWVVRQAREWLTHPNHDAARAELAEWLTALRLSYGYKSVTLLDAQLVPRLSVPAAETILSPTVPGAARDAMRTGEVVLGDLYRHGENGLLYIDVVSPLLEAGSPAGSQVGAILLRVNPDAFLFPLIQRWPTPSPSAETLLVRREGDDVLYLNELRHRAGTALALRRPLSEASLPAAMGLRGEEGPHEGLDYRGVQVVAVTRHIPGTTWMLVAKVDRAELYAPVRREAYVLGATTATLLLAAALGVAWQARRRKVQVLKEHLAAERERRALAERSEHLMRAASDAIVIADETDHILEVNDRACALYGYSQVELRGMSLLALRAAAERADFGNRASELASTGRADFETRHRRKDGSTFPVEISSRLVEIGGERFKLGIIRDITARVAHEAQIERLGRLYATLTQVNQLIVRCQSRERLLTETCRVTVEYGRFVTARVSWKTPDGEGLTEAAGWGAPHEVPLSMPDWQGTCSVVADSLRTAGTTLCLDATAAVHTGCCRETLTRLGVRACAAFPLRLRGNVCGALSVCASDPAYFGDEEVRLLEEVAVDVSFAIERLDDEVRRREAEADQATQARVGAVFSTASGENLFSDALKVMLDVLDSSTGAFGALDDRGLSLVSVLAGTSSPDRYSSAHLCLLPHGEWETRTWSRALREKAPVVSDERIDDLPGALDTPLRHLSVPILFRDRPIGLVLVANRSTGYTDADARRLGAIAEQMAPMLGERLRRERTLRALYESEDRFRRAVLASPFPTLIHAEGGEILQVSDSWCDITGYEREALTTVDEWVSRAHGERPTQDIYGLSGGGDGRSGGPHVIHTASGSTRVWEFSSAPLGRLADGRGMVSTMAMDVTDRRRLETERVAMEGQLRQQQKLESIGTLAAGVAHEINNPITGVMNYAELIQDRLPEGSPLKEFTGEIMRETQRVAAIVRNLLTFARDERQTHSPARIEDIIERTLSLIRTVIRRDQITLSVVLADDLPQLRCRSQQIQQVLMNLMTNARDALNARHPGHSPDKVLAVTASLLDKGDRRWIRVTVEDHGTGVAPDVRDRMFDPFFTTKPRDVGTGLGLSISHGIVKDHHGDLTVETELGRFTRVRMDLPVTNGWGEDGSNQRCPTITEARQDGTPGSS